MVSFKHTISKVRPRASIVAAGWLLASAAGAALLAAAPRPAAAAQFSDDVPAVAVKYADLDLNTERGARDLLARIRLAADQVCPAAADSRALSRVEAHASCVREAIARAVEQVGSPRLAAVYSARANHG